MISNNQNLNSYSSLSILDQASTTVVKFLIKVQGKEICDTNVACRHGYLAVSYPASMVEPEFITRI